VVLDGRRSLLVVLIFSATCNRLLSRVNYHSCPPPLNKQEIKQKASAPGPGYYNLPAAIKVDEKPAKVQNFSSSGERFRDVSFRKELAL
jgi:hypothetical protein